MKSDLKGVSHLGKATEHPAADETDVVEDHHGESASESLGEEG